MLAARRPFRGPDVGTKPRLHTTQSDLDQSHALLHRIIHDAPPPLALGAEAPAGLTEMLFEKLLIKDPDKRYQSMKMVQGALEAFHGVLRQARPSGSIPPLNIPAATPAPFPRIGDLAGVAEPDAYPVGSNPAMTDPLAQHTTGSRVSPLQGSQTQLPVTRGPSIAWLILAIVIAAAGAGAFYLDTQQRAKAIDLKELRAPLEADAEKIGSLLDQAANAAHLRADGIATTPMLRAAIETDAATLKDMAGSDFIFTPAKGERLELFQVREGVPPRSLLRIPENGAPIAPLSGSQTRIDRDGGSIIVVASAPVTQMSSGVGGSLAIAMTVDLEAIKHKVAPHVLEATLVGMGEPIELAPGTHPGLRVDVPVTTSQLKTDSVSLSAVISEPSSPAPTYLYTAYTGWALGGLLLLAWVIRLLRSRARD